MGNQGGQQPLDTNENEYMGTQMNTSTVGQNEGHKPADDDVIVVGEPNKPHSIVSGAIVVVSALILVNIAGIFINHANSHSNVSTQFVTQDGECYRVEGNVPSESIYSTSEMVEYMREQGVEPRLVACYKPQA